MCAYMLLDTITPSSSSNCSVTERDNAARFSEIETDGPGDSESPIKSILTLYGLTTIGQLGREYNGHYRQIAHGQLHILLNFQDHRVTFAPGRA